MFVILNLVKKVRRLQLYTIHMTDAESSAVDALDELPVSMAKEPGPSIIKEAKLLKEEDPSYTGIGKNVPEDIK